MGTTDYVARPAPNITMTTPFSDSLAVHVPRITAPTLEDQLEDLLEAQVPAGPVHFSHVDVVWTPEADKDLLT